MLTAATRTNSGLPWQQQRRSTPSVSQIRKVAKNVREGDGSTWHDSTVRAILLHFMITLFLF